MDDSKKISIVFESLKQSFDVYDVEIKLEYFRSYNESLIWLSVWR